MSPTAASGAGPGNRPGIPLEGEPFGFFNALTAGDAVPVPTAVDGDAPVLEEEPALWPTPEPPGPA